jgi:hypothetical protein
MVREATRDQWLEARLGLTNLYEGDYLLAVNGEPLDPKADLWAAFQGLADKPVFLTVNTNPVLQGAREVLVQTLSSEARLRHLAWIDANRRRVEKMSDGKIGYVYVADTSVNGQNELVRQWRGQVTKAGLIIDERFNSGGQIPDRFVELLNRPLRTLWGVRDGKDWTWPPVGHYGPKAMLMNGWSGSGGDCLPYYFKQSGQGPLIGQRTWGGLIGIPVSRARRASISSELPSPPRSRASTASASAGSASAVSAAIDSAVGYSAPWSSAQLFVVRCRSETSISFASGRKMSSLVRVCQFCRVRSCSRSYTSKAMTTSASAISSFLDSVA